jgi:hypothetical protein
MIELVSMAWKAVKPAVIALAWPKWCSHVSP